MSGSDLRQLDREIDGPSYVEVAMGLVFVLTAAAVFSTGLTSGVFFFGFPLLLPAAWLLGRSIQDTARRRLTPKPPDGKERELLSAIQGSGEGITPMEAAMQTSLTVNEADRMLSELASGGHLRVEAESGEATLSYALPVRRDPSSGG